MATYRHSPNDRQANTWLFYGGRGSRLLAQQGLVDFLQKSSGRRVELLSDALDAAPRTSCRPVPRCCGITTHGGADMKCHAGIEFESGKPCPKCNAKLGDVCWPGINADLLEVVRLRKENEQLRDIARRVSDLPYFKNRPIEALVSDARAALAVPPSDQVGDK